MTPRLFHGLLKRHEERLRREDFRFGQLWALRAEISRDEKKRGQPYTWLDAFPQWHEPTPEQDEDQMLEAMVIWSNRKPAVN